MDLSKILLLLTLFLTKYKLKGDKCECSVRSIWNSFYYPSIETSIYNSLIRNGQTVTIISIERAIKTAFKIRPDFILVLHSLHVDLKRLFPS